MDYGYQKKMERIIQEPSYWIQMFKEEFISCIEDYMDNEQIDIHFLSKRLEMPLEEIEKILYGEFDFKISEIFQICTKIKIAPYVYFKKMEKVLERNRNGKLIQIDFEKLEKNHLFNKNIT